MPNHLITTTAAAAMTSNFRSAKENMLATNMRNAGTLPICEKFAKNAFDIILGDTNCTAIRIYLGLDENSKVRMIVTGVNASDEDIFIPSSHPANSFDADCVIENGIRCPNECPASSVLNS
jgi:hypothetical protein